MGKAVFSWTTALLVLLTAGCTVSHQPAADDPAQSALVRLSPDRFPDFGDAMAFDGLAYAIEQSQRYLSRLPSDTAFRFGPDTYTAQHLKASLSRFLDLIEARPDPAVFRQQIADAFRVYQSPGGPNTEKVLFTGYYEPVLSGSPIRTETHRHPLYACPDDLVEIDLSLFSDRYAGQKIVGRLDGRSAVPYYDRQQIVDQNRLAGKAKVLAWVRDPVNLFFLHIQGSGRVVMSDGSTLNVHYAGANGKPYRSIGRRLIDRGAVRPEAMSMQAIRRWLRQHPEEMDETLNHNPSYVFFETVEAGPLGCINVLLTPGRSVATDRRLFPMSALAYVTIRQPLIDGDGKIQSWHHLDRFVLNQDTGGAIRGPGRADLFFGGGPYAETAAGHLKHDGDLFFLVLRPENKTD